MFGEFCSPKFLHSDQTNRHASAERTALISARGPSFSQLRRSKKSSFYKSLFLCRGLSPLLDLCVSSSSLSPSPGVYVHLRTSVFSSSCLLPALQFSPIRLVFSEAGDAFFFLDLQFKKNRRWSVRPLAFSALRRHSCMKRLVLASTFLARQSIPSPAERPLNRTPVYDPYPFLRFRPSA